MNFFSPLRTSEFEIWISVVFQNFSSNLSRMKYDSQQKSSYQPNAIYCARKENLNTFLWLAILLFYLGLPPIFEKKNADRGKLPSCFTERLKNHLKYLIWILFGTKQFVFNGTSEASSVVKWDFFEWFSTTIFWKEKYRKIAQLFTGTDAHCLQII